MIERFNLLLSTQYKSKQIHLFIVNCLIGRNELGMGIVKYGWSIGHRRIDPTAYGFYYLLRLLST